MNNATCTRLQRFWDRRREAIAEHWSSAIAQTGFVPLGVTEVRRRIAELTEQVIAVLAAEPFDQDKARAIGGSLASLYHAGSNTLALTVQVLANQLTQDLPAENVMLLQPRLSALLGGLSAGFVQQSTSILLSEQERIRGALVVSLQEAQQALQTAYDQVEAKVKERTAELETSNRQLEQEIAERQRIEAALRASEARYRAVSELSADLAYAYRVGPDSTFELEWATDAAVRISGYELEEFIARGGWASLLHPDDRALMAQRHKAMVSGQTIETEFRMLTKQGQTRWLHVTGRPVWDPVQGRIVRIESAGQDITERKQIEAALQESEEKYRSLVERATDGIAFIQDGVFKYANPHLATMWGGTVDEMIGRSFTDLAHPDALPQLMDRRSQRMAGDDAPALYESAIRRKDSSKLLVEVNASRVTYQGKRASLVIVRDITERKRMEEVLQRRSLDLLQIYRMSQTLAATLDSRQVLSQLVQAVTDITQAAGCSIWLWAQESADELICHATFPPSMEGRLVGLRRSTGQGVVGWVVQNGKSAIVADALDDARFLPDIDAKTGFRTTSLLATPLRVHDAVIGVLEVVNKRDGEFNAHDQTLVETLSGSAAIAIKNAQLVESLRQIAATLKTRNEELDTFSHTVAHDLKGPLINVLGSAEVLAEEPSTLTQEERRRFTQSVVRNGRKMDNIIDELMILAGLRNVQIVAEPLEMLSIVAEARLRLTDMFTAYQAEVVVPAVWPTALGHAPWIEEVWVNYLSNAVKYGGRPPRVELGGEVQQDGTARFWVRDNGPGITPEDRTRLFAPGTRLYQTRAQGHGLGLSIVQRIVEKQGGRVGVTSTLGQGSTFFFSLPTQRADLLLSDD